MTENENEKDVNLDTSEPVETTEPTPEPTAENPTPEHAEHSEASAPEGSAEAPVSDEAVSEGPESVAPEDDGSAEEVAQPEAQPEAQPAESEPVVEAAPVAEAPAAEAEAPAAKVEEAQPAPAPKQASPAAVAEVTEFVNPMDSLPDDTWGEDGDDDWLMEDDYTPDKRKEFEKMYESTLSEVKEQEIVPGTVVSIGDKEVVLNIGFKSEGIVPVSEFRDMEELKIGDTVDVYLDSVEDKNGQLILSRKRAKHMRTWAKILEAEHGDIVLEGHIKRRTKGGFVVDIEGIEAFLPGSQIDVKPVRDFDAYVGKVMDFKVVKINHPFENVVISHKVLIEKDLEKQRQEILKNLERGQVLEGTVKNMTNFGVFIDLGGVDGLLHITDISWGRINHPEEVLELDQKINIVVLDFDDDKKRISLGLKQLEPHPWDSLPENIAEGSKVRGKVVTVADYGVFVEILPGVEGLVHMSEMSWSQHLKNPTELFKIGDEVEATVLSIDREERKMSLGLKQSKEDPWLNAGEKYAVGTRHKGMVRNMTNYGLFVELEEGVDGLVHISDLSWTKKYSHPSEFINKDEELEVVVLDIDISNRRLSLGHKQLTEDVWETFESIFVVGSNHSGTILNINDKGATVELEYGVEGFVPARHLEPAPNESKLKKEDKADFQVIDFNKDQKKLVLSHSLTWDPNMIDELKPKKKKKPKKPAAQAKQQQAKQDTTTLGEIDALAQLKAKLEKAEAEEARKKIKEQQAKLHPGKQKRKEEEEEEEAPVEAGAEVAEAPEAAPAEAPATEPAEETAAVESEAEAVAEAEPVAESEPAVEAEPAAEPVEAVAEQPASEGDDESEASDSSGDEAADAEEGGEAEKDKA